VIVVILMLVWLVALLPLALRKLSEWQLSSSVSQFDHRTRLLRRTYPAMARRAAEGAGHATAGRAPQGAPAPDGGARQPAAASPPARRAARERARQRLARRRRTLAVLACTALGTFVLGAIPALRALWDLTVVDLLLTAGFVALLVHFRRLETTSGEHRDAAIPLRVVEGGRQPATITPLPPARPAFVILEAMR